MKILLIFFISFPIFASNLLTYNVYERDDRVDIMLSFDTPYDGNLIQSGNNKDIKLLLSDLSVDNEINKSLNSPILQNIIILNNDKNSTKVELKSNSPISITASKTTDKFGLRIRATKQSNVSKNEFAIPTIKAKDKGLVMDSEIKTKPSNSDVVIPSSIKTKDQVDGSDIDKKYIIVISILFILLVILLIVKRLMLKKQEAAMELPFTITESKKFSSNRKANTNPKKSKPFSINDNENLDIKHNSKGVEIIYEKNLDTLNKVALLSYENRKYLILFGNSNVLLDKFGEDNISDEEDFEIFFEQNKQKLGKYLEERKNSLTSYKDMISKD